MFGSLKTKEWKSFPGGENKQRYIYNILWDNVFVENGKTLYLINSVFLISILN